MDSFSAAVEQNRLTQDVASVAPLATTYHAATPVPVAPAMQPVTAQPSNVGKALSFFKDVGSSIGHVATQATDWLGKQVVTAVEAPVKFGSSIGNLIVDNSINDSINKNSTLTQQRITATIQAYKAGTITQKEYQQSLGEYTQSLRNLDNEATSDTSKTTKDAGNFVDSSINTAADVVTILTLGVGGTPLRSVATQTTARWLASDAADAVLFKGAANLSQLAVSDAAFKGLSEATQLTMQRAVAEVVANTTVHLSAPQLARAAVVNMALKFPISFNYISSSAQDFYHQLDNDKYGAAVRNVAVNSLFVLGGGPVHEALSYLKKGSKIADNLIFGEGSFIDELSKNTGDGSPDGIANYLNTLDPETRVEYVKNLSATATRNTLAVKGNPIQGAWRVLNNMSAMYQEIDWRGLSHGEIVEDLNREAAAARITAEQGKLLGIKNAVVGRLDRRDLQTISATLTKDSAKGTDLVNNAYAASYAKKYSVDIDEAKASILQTMIDTGKVSAEEANPTAVPLTPEVALKRWAGLQQQFPNAAFANNANLDRQVKGFIAKYTNAEGVVDAGLLDKSLRGISTQEMIKEFPASVRKQLGQLGYIPIVPKNLENPFVEGTGKLTTSFTEGAADPDSLFTKAVQPMPVAAQFGNALTRLGLSPQASTGRAYQFFHNALTDNLRDVGLADAKDTVTAQQDSDTLYKQLSSYAASPTRGGIKGIRPPITDMRQLTTKDIMAATGKGSTDAKNIKSALKQAWLDVPLQIRGLGDRAVDLNYKLNPTASAYARIMSATRFSWNPFFQAKTLTKTESLVQLKTGGTFPTTLGMDKLLGTIFPDKYRDIDNVRNALHEEGIFSNARGPVVAGEAAEYGGEASAPLTHKLLSGQEKAISALISVQADKAGMDAVQFVRQYPDVARDTVQTVASYDKSSNLLSSPLARTLNFAFFPYRFEAKVTQVMAKSLAKTSVLTQMATIRGIYNGSQFLKSPEGQAWYSNNSELIGLLKYFTPLTTISTLAEAFGQKPESVGQFGELGGLPFGFIPMLLDAEGITNGLTQSPYVNPKTGQTLPNYIPITAKGHAIAGIQDFLGSLFTYPGTQAGLPSKTAFFHDLSVDMLAGHTSDFNKVTPDITNASQQSFAATVQQMSGNTTPTAPTAPTAPTQAVNVPTNNQATINVPAKQSGSSTPKKKKADYTPQLLPGQTFLGESP